MNNFWLWIAQGFGTGRIPFAPGTFGSLIGFLWLLVLLQANHPLILLAGALGLVPMAVAICSQGERILQIKDPSSIVLDEMAAVPFCFGVWLAQYAGAHGDLPKPEYFFQENTWPLTIAVLISFRFFDIVKPWPIRKSQQLPGGWGIAADDLLAAAYVSILAWIASAAAPFTP